MADIYLSADELEALVEYFELLTEIDKRERDEKSDERYNDVKEEGRDVESNTNS